MKWAWHIVTRTVFAVIAVFWLMTTAHEVACHRDQAMCGDGDDGCAQTECVCLCACHAAIETDTPNDFCTSGRLLYVPSEYVTLRGASVPTDIFRPPLANS